MMNIFSKLKGALMGLFNGKEAARRLSVHSINSTIMEDAIKRWSTMYSTVPDGKGVSLNLPYSICHELARLATLEFSSEMSGSKRAEYLTEHYSKVVGGSPEWVEYACAMGGVMLKPYITEKSIAVDYVRADAFTPCGYDSAGNITACIFYEKLTKGSKHYTRLEYHELNGATYAIKNKAYVSVNSDDIGHEISLESVNEWSELEPELTLENISRPLYVYMRIPGGNTIDRLSPLGVSAFHAAVDVILEADKQYNRLLWEYEGSELAVMVDETMLNLDNKLPKVNKRLFRGLNSDGDLFEVFSPAIRDTALINGLDEQLRHIELLCGLAYGTFSRATDTAKTATEIKASRQRSYATVSAIQRAIRKALTEYAEVLDIYCDLYKLAPKGKIEQSFDFDDSLITDSETEQRLWLQEVAAGLMSPVEYRMKRYGETAEQAAEMLPDAFGGDE